MVVRSTTGEPADDMLSSYEEPPRAIGTGVILCVWIITALSAFGNIQKVFLPGAVEGGLYLAACLGLALLILCSGRPYPNIIGILFLLGLNATLSLQLLWAENVESIAIKTLGTGLLFVLFASIPALTPALLVVIIRRGACFHVVASTAIVALSGVGIRHGVGPGWVGWFDQKNYLGLTAAIACATLAAQALAERRVRAHVAALGVVAVVVLIMANSRGALLWLLTFSCCIGLAMLGFHPRRVVKFLLVLCVTLLATIVLAPDTLLRSLGDFTTGRTILWEQARTAFESAPWIGQGLGWSYTTGARFLDDYGNVYRGMHNGFLAILIDMGIIGLVIYISMILMTVAVVARLPSVDAIVLLSMLAAFITYNFVESALDKTTNISLVIFPLCIAACVSQFQIVRLNPSQIWQVTSK